MTRGRGFIINGGPVPMHDFFNDDFFKMEVPPSFLRNSKKGAKTVTEETT